MLAVFDAGQFAQCLFQPLDLFPRRTPLSGFPSGRPLRLVRISHLPHHLARLLEPPVDRRPPPQRIAPRLRANLRPINHQTL